MKYKKHILWKPGKSLLETFRDYIDDIKTYFTNDDGSFCSFRVNKKSQSVRFPEFMAVYDTNYPSGIYLEVIFALYKGEELRTCPFCGNVLYIRNVKQNIYYQVCSKACDAKLKSGCTRTPTKNVFFSTHYPGTYHDRERGYVVPDYCKHNKELVITLVKAKALHEHGGSFCEECNKERFYNYNPDSDELADDINKIKTILIKNKSKVSKEFLLMHYPELFKSLQLYYKTIFPSYAITHEPDNHCIDEMKYCVTRDVTQTPRCQYHNCNAITKFTGTIKGYAKYCDEHRGLSFESQQEKDLISLCESLCSSYRIIKGDRTVLSGHELDIYIPELNKAIEYNGIWFHSYPNKEKDYHYNKFKLARDKGIDLLFIWEDEFLYDADNVVLRIKNFLNTTDVIDYTEILSDIESGKTVEITVINRYQDNELYRCIKSNYDVDETVELDSKIRYRYEGDTLNLLCYGTGITKLIIKNRT